MPRPNRPLLSRDRIIDAALELVDTDGLEALSTRRLATALGVAGPSLYNHVGTMEELRDAVIDKVLAAVDTSMFTGLGPDNLDWATAVDAWARSYRAAVGAHPRIAPALAIGPGLRPNALRIADAVFGGLVAAGWPRRQATTVGALMRYFVIGSALGSFAAGFPTDATVYTADYPHLTEAHLLADRQQDIDQDAFDTGIEALLESLQLRYDRLRHTP